MNILFFSRRSSCTRCITLGWRALAGFGLLAVLVVSSGSLYMGYRWGQEARPVVAAAPLADGPLAQAVVAQQQAVTDAARSARQNLDALAIKLGQMQAHVTRLDALGQRLVQMGGLDDGEFDFKDPPAQGGPYHPELGKTLSVGDFVSRLEALSARLEDRGQQLGVLESVLMNRDLQEQVYPSGRPIKGGWISSGFGERTDPFTGKLERHDGLDFAGKSGSDVMAVAAGVVTWAGDRYGYGKLVEINHGNGYHTRYGHNKKLKVKVGDTVKKGQVIALLGSTGRSTGPHVHFEVRKNGRVIDPTPFVQASR